MSELKWTRRTTEAIAAELKALDISVSPRSVAALLRNMGYSLRVNHKKVAISGKATTDARLRRDQQFLHIAKMRTRFADKGMPVISVDTKKKELVGNFKNNGVAWRKTPDLVYDHDFPSYADGKAIPYGVYDLHANQGSVFVGTSHDTPSFATDCIARWWSNEGCHRYPNAKKLLILADNGGSNSPRCDQWLYGLAQKLCKAHGLSVTVCHYPPGASKWNPIEHRLFSEISKKWAGIPLRTYNIVLETIRKTCTKTGLRVRAYVTNKKYKLKQKPSKEEMDTVKIAPHPILPDWNYTITLN